MIHWLKISYVTILNFHAESISYFIILSISHLAVDPAIFSVLKVNFTSKYGVRAKTPLREEDEDDDDDRASSLSPACSFRSERGFSTTSSASLTADGVIGGGGKKHGVHHQRRHRQISDPFSSQTFGSFFTRSNNNNNNNCELTGMPTSNVSSRYSSREDMLDVETGSSGGGVQSTTPSRSASDAGISLPVFQLKMLTQRLKGGHFDIASAPASPSKSALPGVGGDSAQKSTLTRVSSLKTPSPAPSGVQKGRHLVSSGLSPRPGSDSAGSGVVDEGGSLKRGGVQASNESVASSSNGDVQRPKAIISVSSVPFIRQFRVDLPQVPEKAQQQSHKKTASHSAPAVRDENTDPARGQNKLSVIVQKPEMAMVVVAQKEIKLSSCKNIVGDGVDIHTTTTMLGRDTQQNIINNNVILDNLQGNNDNEVDEGCVDPEDLDSDYELIEKPRLKSPRNVKVKILPDPSHPVILKPKNTKSKRPVGVERGGEISGDDRGRYNVDQVNNNSSDITTNNTTNNTSNFTSNNIDMSRGSSNASIKSDTILKSALKNSSSLDNGSYARTNRSLTHPTKRISTINEEDFGSLDTNGLGSVASIKVGFEEVLCLDCGSNLLLKDNRFRS